MPPPILGDLPDRAKFPMITRPADAPGWAPAIVPGRRSGEISLPHSTSASGSPLRRDLSARIGSFYDDASDLWEGVWGAHMHHGHYGPDGLERPATPQEAQRLLIEELLRWGEVRQAANVLDVGCGIGGSTLYLASRFGAAATGVTLSGRQAERARQRSTAAGLGDRVRLQVADAAALPFADGSFDLVWSLESGEHMPDKGAFLRECCRVLAPGGRLIVATWCHREDGAPQPPLAPAEERLLERICRLYHLPEVVPLSRYEELSRDCPLTDLRFADWSEAVAPFWAEVLRSALRPDVLPRVMTAGWSTVRGALAIPLMMEGFRSGLIRYGLLTGIRA
jgi:tocopherol O-methyltransferase